MPHRDEGPTCVALASGLLHEPPPGRLPILDRGAVGLRDVTCFRKGQTLHNPDTERPAATAPRRSSTPMKFDSRSPRSWAVFLAIGSNVVLVALLARLMHLLGMRRRRRPRLVLHSHEFAGNVRALADFAPPDALAQWDVRFLYLAPEKFRAHQHQSVRPLLALRPWHLLWAAHADALVCTHGLGVLGPLPRVCPDLRTIDVWHGIGFKPRDQYVRKTRGFTQLFLPSPWVEELYRDMGVPAERMKVTGHGSWDPLVRERDCGAILRDYGLEGEYRARILVAPTWTHGELWKQREVFGCAWEDVSDELADWATRHDVQLIFRSHLNAGKGLITAPANVANRPFSEYPLTYDLLKVTDVLVTDWSSIATDFLPSRRPIIYLDVPPPFRPGYLRDADRVGPRAASTQELTEALELATYDPAAIARQYREEQQALLDKVCSGYADGSATERYLNELQALVGPA